VTRARMQRSLHAGISLAPPGVRTIESNAAESVPSVGWTVRQLRLSRGRVLWGTARRARQSDGI